MAICGTNYDHKAYRISNNSVFHYILAGWSIWGLAQSRTWQQSLFPDNSGHFNLQETDLLFGAVLGVEGPNLPLPRLTVYNYSAKLSRHMKFAFNNLKVLLTVSVALDTASSSFWSSIRGVLWIPLQMQNLSTERTLNPLCPGWFFSRNALIRLCVHLSFSTFSRIKSSKWLRKI